MDYRKITSAYLSNPQAKMGKGYHLATSLDEDIEVALEIVQGDSEDDYQVIVNSEGEPTLIINQSARWAYALDGRSLGEY